MEDTQELPCSRLGPHGLLLHTLPFPPRSLGSTGTLLEAIHFQLVDPPVSCWHKLGALLYQVIVGVSGWDSQYA